MKDNIENYQLVEVYEQGVWNTVWQRKETHDPRAPKWFRDYVEAKEKSRINKSRQYGKQNNIR